MSRNRYALAAAVLLPALAVLLFSAASVAGQGDAERTPYAILFTNGEWATVTPAASRTPTPTLTYTPPATLTPTSTPTEASTEVVTPEVMTPVPATPGPSATPIDKNFCYAGVATNGNLNVRKAPTTNSAVVGTLAHGDRVQVVFLWMTTTENDPKRTEWGKLGDDRWIALWYGGQPLAVLDDTAPCWELPRDGPGAVPAPLLAGIHVLFDTQAQNITILQGDIGTLKTTSGDEGLGSAWKQANPNGLWFHRGLNHDQPQIYEWLLPSLFVDRIQDEWNTGADYYEIINEVGAPTWEMFADFTIGLLEAATAREVCIAWGSFAAGNPDYPAWAELVRVIEYADDHPCQPGRYHAIAVHQPLYLPADIARQAGDWMDNPHIVDRLAYVDALVKQYTGAGLAEHRGGAVYITEMGLDDGYSGAWSDVWTDDEIARAFWLSVDELARFVFVRGFHLWTWGDGQSIWTDRQTSADEIHARGGRVAR